MKAVVTAEWTPQGVEALRALGYEVTLTGWGTTRRELDAAGLVAASAGASLLVVELEAVSAQVLAQLPDLRLLGTARGTPSNVDIDACTARGVPVLHTPARNAESVADFVLGLLLSLARGISAGERSLRDSGWLVNGELPYLHFRGPELAGRTLGLVGYGAVGRAVARRAEHGFGMRIVYTDPHVPGGVGLPELLAEADVVSLHCPRSPETTGLIDAAALARMRPSAYLINTAGGGVVDTDALIAALRSGAIAGAALDVYDTEPLPRDSPLLGLDNVVLTPHLAGAAYDVVGHHTRMLCADIAAVRRGDPPAHCANPVTLPGDLQP